LTDFALDRASPLPFHFQLATALRREINAGRWQPGDQLASEPALSAQFAVSRSVVRQALASLVDEGMLHREKGRGTFVADTRQRSWLLQFSEGFFHDEAERFGVAVTSELLQQEVTQLPDWAAHALGLPRGSAGVTLARLRSVEGEVAIYSQNYLLPEVAATVLGLRPQDSLYEALARRDGLVVHGGRRVVEAVTAGKHLGHLLDVPARAALAFVQSVSWDPTGRPCDCFQAWLRTDRTRLEIQITRHGSASRRNENGFDGPLDGLDGGGNPIGAT
jgi:GntR family transcriptional regulator